MHWQIAVLQLFQAKFPPSTWISFTKLKSRQSFWGAEQLYISIGPKVMTKMKNTQKCKKRKNHQKHYIRNFFLQNRNRTKMEKIAFCVITFDPIKIQTHSAPQNDRLNFSFVKDFFVLSWKMARNGRKWIVNFIFFSYKIEKTETKLLVKKCEYVSIFRTLSTHVLYKS